MALPKIIFNQSANGLGRPLTGSDFISGLMFYYPSGGTLPTGFSAATTAGRVKPVFSVPDAEDLGITDTGLGATASTHTFTVTNKGAVGDTMSYTAATIEAAKAGLTVILAAYTQVTADVVSTTTAAARLVAEINAKTVVHGFSAANTGAVVTITAPVNEGIFLNSGSPFVSTIVGTLAGTIVQNVVAGVASWINILHYQVSEYFREQPQGKLWICLFVEEATYAFADITTAQTFTNGEVKQFGIYQKNVAFSLGQCTALQAVQAANELLYQPFVSVFGAEISGTASVATLTDATSLTAKTVSINIAQDGYNKGYKLWKATGKSIGSVGTELGSISFAAVNESIAWVQKFQTSDGNEFDTLAFANGQLYSDVSQGQLESLHDYGYTFLLKQIGLTGSYWSDSTTAVISTSDYSTIENNRVYQKTTRVVRVAILPSLNSPLLVNKDGTLRTTTIGYFESLCQRPITQMEADGEISATKVIINPAQDVLATSKIEITLQEVPTGVARIIKINVGFVKSV